MNYTIRICKTCLYSTNAVSPKYWSHCLLLHAYALSIWQFTREHVSDMLNRVICFTLHPLHWILQKDVACGSVYLPGHLLLSQCPVHTFWCSLYSFTHVGCCHSDISSRYLTIYSQQICFVVGWIDRSVDSYVREREDRVKDGYE